MMQTWMPLCLSWLGIGSAPARCILWTYTTGWAPVPW